MIALKVSSLILCPLVPLSAATFFLLTSGFATAIQAQDTVRDVSKQTQASRSGTGNWRNIEMNGEGAWRCTGKYQQPSISKSGSSSSSRPGTSSSAGSSSRNTTGRPSVIKLQLRCSDGIKGSASIQSDRSGRGETIKFTLSNRAKGEVRLVD